jgi:DHA2 family multidrug resistance protein
MRNLGGAIGIATVNTWLQDWTRAHTAHFGETLGHSGREAQEVIAAVAARFSQITPDVQHALMMAKSVFGATVAADAFTLAFNDVFMLMSWMFLAALLMVPFCRK